MATPQTAFISFSKNFEDVMLWRAFCSVETGFYIDIGTADPDVDSVTRAFYDRGWRGINVEPSGKYFNRLTSARSRDINLNRVVGSKTEKVTLFQAQSSGLSKIDQIIANQPEWNGSPSGDRKPLQVSLADICRQHAPRDIHFLRINAESVKGGALNGADFEYFRPRIVLVETIRPNSHEQDYADWEHILTGLGYEFVYFDALNRFYVAHEHLEALRPHFRLPPNVFDNFLLSGDAAISQRIRTAEMATAEAWNEKSRTAHSLSDALGERQRIAQALETARQELDEAQARIHFLEASSVADCDDSPAQLEIATHRNETLSRTAWCLPAPLRSVWFLSRGRFGLALAAAGLAQSRVERLGRVAGADGSLIKRSSRVMFYCAMRLLSRTPGMDRLAAKLDRRGFRLWRWLASHGAAYTASALRHGTEAVSSPLQPSRLTSAVPRKSLPASRPGKEITTVHQFHSGSAVGDAITNGMLLIRSCLRDLGYRSEIYVQHRDPRLADGMLLLDDLPSRDDCILIVHHSIGHDVLDRVLTLPARKILAYHNIMPVEFVADAPRAIPHAEFGRRTLHDIRPFMLAALADSEYDAQELRVCGYASVATCTLLFDVDALLSRTQTDAPRSGPDAFTMLFVGQVTAKNSQADLVDAFAAFRDAWRKPCRLVLVAHTGVPDASYLAEIRRRIAKHDLGADVLLTGPVSEDELHGWYRAADLYVSLSQHEAVALPLVEAMAHRVPVIAWPAGAVPYTLGYGMGNEADLLLDRQPGTVANAILRLARDPARLTAVIARQLRMLDSFRLGQQLPQLLRALATAGAIVPPSRESRSSLAANIRFALSGHINGSYSLAATNRTTAIALEAGRPGSVRVLPVEGAPTTDISGVPTSQAAFIGALVARPEPPSGPEVALSHHYPVYVPEAEPGSSIAIFAWEETSVPAETVQLLNRHFRAVFAISRYVAKALVDSGVSIPVYAEGIAIDLSKFSMLAGSRTQRPSAGVTFLHVSSGFPRKGVDILLDAYAHAFRADDPVRLVIKTFPNPHNDVPDQIERLRQVMPDLPEIVLINQDLEEDALIDLYRSADALVLPSRGEGFNMPAAEAMAAGIPLIVTGHGGHLDFCTSEEARFVDFRFAPASSHLASDGSFWVEPDTDDLAAALRDAAGDILADGGVCAARATKARAAVLERLNPAAVAQRMIDNAVEALLQPAPPPLRLAWVSTWDVPCGVAEYSRALLTAMLPAPDDYFAKPVILCDHRTVASSEVNGPRIEPTWHDASTASVMDLAGAIARNDPDAVIIQHQPGLISWRGLAGLLNDRRVNERITVVVLHNAQNLIEIDETDRAAATAALACASRVLVHRLADLDFLRRFGVLANVVVFPHGAPPQAETPAPRILNAVVRTASPVIGCFGFFLPGKGIPRLIAAVAKLRQAWPHLRVRLVNAEYPLSVSTEEIARCRVLARELGIEGCIEWHTAFLPTDDALELLGGCDLLILPYDETLESASGAVRIALASGVPVAVTPVAIFEDAGPAVHRFSGMDIAGIVTELDALLCDTAGRQRLKAAASAWLEARSWPSLGRRLRGMVLGLRAERSIRRGQRASWPVSD